MKTVKVNPYRIYKVTRQEVKNSEANLHPESNPNIVIKEVIKNIRKTGSSNFLAIVPETMEAFTFIPIIEKEQLFASVFPNPVQLYFSIAYNNYQFARQTRHNIVIQKDQTGPFNRVNSYLYNWHLQCKISSIIFLHSTIEAFINYMMPEDFIYKQEITSKQSDKFIKQIREFTKEQTERYIQFKEKVGKVVSQITSLDFQKSNKKTFDQLLNLNTLRNDLIHLRSTKKNNEQQFELSVASIVNVDLSIYVKAVQGFINTIKPNLIELTEIPKDEVYNFNFNHIGAFKADISVFIKLLECPSKRVNLNIPKSDESTFQLHLNWIMQNLNVLAEEQLIYFPVIKINTKKKLRIEIIKTDKRIGSDLSWDV